MNVMLLFCITELPKFGLDLVLTKTYVVDPFYFDSKADGTVYISGKVTARLEKNKQSCEKTCLYMYSAVNHYVMLGSIVSYWDQSMTHVSQPLCSVNNLL